MKTIFKLLIFVNILALTGCNACNTIPEEDPKQKAYEDSLMQIERDDALKNAALLLDSNSKNDTAKKTHLDCKK